MKEAMKSLASKSQVDTAHDIADKNIEKNVQTFDLHYLSGRRYFGDGGSQNELTSINISTNFTMPTGDTTI